MSLFTDNEGGNLRLSAPDGTVWEADAYNGGYRIFTYANGVKEGFTIDKSGQTWFTNGIYAKNIGYVGNTMYAQMGCGGISFYGHVYTYMLANAVIVKLTGAVGERYKADEYDWNLGINLTAILKTFNLDANLNLQTSQVQCFLPDGKMYAQSFGYSSFFVQKMIGNEKVLTPARFYTTTGAIGEWPSSYVIYAPGTIWTAELVLQ